jgi:hypothetical protein
VTAMGVGRRFGFGIPALCIFLGCESIALMPRPDIEPPPDSPPVATRRTDRVPSGIHERDLSRGDTTATVERLDEDRQELYLRAADGRVSVMTYDPGTVVLSEGRELSPNALRDGDLVRVQSTRAGGTEYANVIRIERLESGSIHY